MARNNPILGVSIRTDEYPMPQSKRTTRALSRSRNLMSPTASSPVFVMTTLQDNALFISFNLHKRSDLRAPDRLIFEKSPFLRASEALNTRFKIYM